MQGLKNEAASKNLVICLDGPRVGRGGALWIEDPQGTVHRQITPGVQLAGRVHNLRHKALLFDPSKWHGTEPWSGKRLVVTAYTAGLWENLSEQDRIALRELCFPLPKPKQAAASAETELQPKQSIALTSMPPSITQPIIGKPEDDLIFSLLPSKDKPALQGNSVEQLKDHMTALVAACYGPLLCLSHCFDQTERR